MSTQVTCPHCGASNVEGAGFCESCGKAMPSTARSGPRVLTGDAVPTSGVGHAMVSDQLHKEMRKASWALLAVAILQTIVGPIMLVAAASNGGQQVAIPQ